MSRLRVSTIENNNRIRVLTIKIKSFTFNIIIQNGTLRRHSLFFSFIFIPPHKSDRFDLKFIILIIVLDCGINLYSIRALGVSNTKQEKYIYLFISRISSYQVLGSVAQLLFFNTNDYY